MGMVKIYKIGKEELYDLYWKQGLTSWEIAEKFGCGHKVILSRMEEFGIRKRNKGTKRIEIDKETLEQLYLVEGLAHWQIAEKLGVSRPFIGKRLIEYGIQKRSRTLPANHEELRKGLLAFWRTEKGKQRKKGMSKQTSEFFTEWWNKPEQQQLKEEFSKRMAENWDNPEFVRKWIESATERGKKISEGLKKFYERMVAEGECYFCKECGQHHFMNSRIGLIHRGKAGYGIYLKKAKRRN